VAGSSLLTLLDDIATVLDDVAILSKVAVKKPQVFSVMTWH
jgi:predicted DNA repair protein MutK